MPKFYSLEIDKVRDIMADILYEFDLFVSVHQHQVFVDDQFLYVLSLIIVQYYFSMMQATSI